MAIWVGVGTNTANWGSEEICGTLDAYLRGIAMAPPLEDLGVYLGGFRIWDAEPFRIDLRVKYNVSTLVYTLGKFQK